MKIATYNIWNSSRGMPLRKNQLINEIKDVNADIICLQEVKSSVYEDLVIKLNEYSYNYYYDSKSELDGLAIFSKYPIVSTNNLKHSASITCECNGLTILVTNVHLPWESIISMEQCIVDILNSTSNTKADYVFLTGDFNCSDKSSVHRYLLGDRTLHNSEANPMYYDLAEAHAHNTGIKPELTLNLKTNPRWKGKSLAVTSGRVDRIYFKDCFPKAYPELKSLRIFGTTVSDESGYCASDHYGVAAEIGLE